MSTTIHIRGLSLDTSRTKLEELFATQGRVESVEIMRDTTNPPTQSALVVLTSSGDAQRALINLNGKDIDGRKVSMRQAMQRKMEVNPNGQAKKST